MIPLQIMEGFPTFNGLLLAVIIAGYILNIICIFNISKLKFKGEGKNAWLAILLTLPLVGGVLYLTMGRSQRIRGEEADFFSHSH